MKLRGYWGTAIMIAFISWLPFLFAMILIELYNESLDLGMAFRNSLLTSIVMASLYGAILGYLYRYHEVKLNIPHTEERTLSLMLELARLGYHAHNKSGEIITFEPNIFGGKLAGNISVFFSENYIVLTGPWFHLDIISKRFSKR